MSPFRINHQYCCNKVLWTPPVKSTKALQRISSAKKSSCRLWIILSLKIFIGSRANHGKIIIKDDASENNLKHLDQEIPLDKFTCVTGCSWCGKSSPVFDTIYAESESISRGHWCKTFMVRNWWISLEGVGFYRKSRLSSEHFKQYNVNPRSIIGNHSEISYYLCDYYFPLLIAAKHPVFQKIVLVHQLKIFLSFIALVL